MKLTKKCEICSKEMRVIPSIFERKRFCSRFCARLWQSIRMKGQNNPAYKGGIAIYTNGKKRIKSESFAYIIGGGIKKAQHRFIVEQVLSRPLKRNEHVHHINGNQLDNKNTNLLVCDVGYHRFLHERMSRLYMKEHFA